ncbi:voltage-dependent N-type calcium channel subunit alpha-1B-like, partial, partial [Paramuricea clavata]
MKPLMQILFLITFIIVIYAIIGLELLVGRFHWTCQNIETGKINDTLLLNRPCGDEGGRTCGPGERCEYINSRAEWPGPHYGITSYDHIFLAMLTVFQCVTMEGWTDIMYISFDAREYEYGVVTSMLYISLLIIGSFFMLNLILGVLSGEFAKERERVENRRSFFKIRRQQQMERVMSGYTDWIIKAEEIIIREEQNEDERQAQAARRIQETMLHKRHSLSESFMNLIDGNKELLNHLNSCRKDAQSNLSN